MGHSRVLFILAAASVLALAADEPAAKVPKAKAKSTPGATVTVTAEARPVEVVATPNPVKVVDSETLEGSGAHNATTLLADLLPGQVATNGGLGSMASLFLGGARSQDTVVLLDGLRATETFGLSTDLASMSLTGIDRAEVLTGPASTLYGADAHGGVVAFSSAAAAPEGTSGDLQGALGSEAIRLGRARVAYGWGSGWVRTDLNARSEEQPTETKDPFRSTGAFLGLGQQLGEAHLLTLSYRNTWMAAPLPWAWDWAPVGPVPRRYDTTQGSTLRFESLSLNLHSNLPAGFRSDLAMGRMEIAREAIGSMFVWAPTSRRDQLTESLSYQRNRFTGTLLLDASAESQWTTPGSKYWTRHEALAMESAVEPIDGLRGVLSLRRQLDRSVDEMGFTPSARIWQTTWKAGVNFQRAAWRLYGSTGTSFNAPSTSALIRNATNGMPTPGNEESHSLLAGLGWAKGPWSLRLDANRIQYDKLLNFVPLGGNNGYYENRSHIRVQGLELTAGWRHDTWNLEAFARSQEGRDFTKPEDQQLRYFQNRPFFSAGLHGDWRLGKFDLAGRFAYLGHRYVYSDDASGTMADRTHFMDLALSATYHLRRDVDLSLRAEHLLQDPFTREDWEQGKDLGANNVAVLPGYPAPTRSITLEARYRF